MSACYGNMLTGQGMWELIPSTLLTTGIPSKMLTGQGGVEADPINIVDVGCLLITGIPSSIPACSASYWSLAGRISSPGISPAAASHWTTSDCIVVRILTSDLVSCVTLSNVVVVGNTTTTTILLPCPSRWWATEALLQLLTIGHKSGSGSHTSVSIVCKHTLGFGGKLTRLLTHLSNVSF